LACEQGCGESWTVDSAEFDPPLTAHDVEQMLVHDLLAHERSEHSFPPEGTAASFRSAPGLAIPDRGQRDAADEIQLMVEDVRALLVALDLGDHARPASPHEVVWVEVLPAIARLRKQLAEAWPERARLAGTVRLIREGARQRIEVDGRRFPWDVALPVNVPVSRRDRPSVVLQLIAERVEVVDTIAPQPAEAADGSDRAGMSAERQYVVEELVVRAEAARGSWVAPTGDAIAATLEVLAHDLGCGCDRSPIGHITEWADARRDSLEQARDGAGQ
jgi:hypothetical protein